MADYTQTGSIVASPVLPDASKVAYVLNFGDGGILPAPPVLTGRQYRDELVEAFDIVAAVTVSGTIGPGYGNRPGPFNLNAIITFPAVEGTFNRSYSTDPPPGDYIILDDVEFFSFYGYVITFPVLSGSQYASYSFITVTPTLLGTQRATMTSHLSIIAPAVLSGRLTVTRRPSTTPEGRRAIEGRRPSLPLLVYGSKVASRTFTTTGNNGVDGLKPYNITDTVLYLLTGTAGVYLGAEKLRSFLVSASYVPTPSDGFYEAGALPGSIGTAWVRSSLDTVMIFRQPDMGEVVWYCRQEGATSGNQDGGFFRWDGTVWKPYDPMSRRALRGQRSFEVLDPDGVCLTLAGLLGAVHAESFADTHSLLDLRDPARTPDDYLSTLAYDFGYPSAPDDDPAVLRRRLRAPRGRDGTTASIEAIITSFGYSGYVRDLWVDPTSPNNWATYASAPPGIRADIDDRGLTLLIRSDSGQKGQDWIEVEHDAEADDLTGAYVPSSRVNVHLNNPNGGPLTVDVAPSATRDIKERVARALSQVLPAHVTVRYFLTDLDAGEGLYRVL